MITLKTLPQATAQEVFDQVERHLLTQNALSLRDESISSCAYRSARDLKCAAGCFIADDEYGAQMEGRRWTDLVDTGAVPSAHSGLIRTLQIVHDCTDVQMWPHALRTVAESFNLSPDVIDELTQVPA